MCDPYLKMQVMIKQNNDIRTADKLRDLLIDIPVPEETAIYFTIDAQ